MTAPTLTRRMTSMDASFLYFERPTTPLHIGSTMILDGHLSRAALVDHMRRRIHRLPRYRQRAMFDPLNLAHPSWEEDPDFDVARHILEVKLPPKATDADLRSAIAGLFAPMLPRDLPLWRLVLIQGLSRRRTAVTSLIHHCMVDGVSGIELLQIMCDLAPDAPAGEAEPYTPPDAVPPLDRVSAAWRDAVGATIDRNAEATRWLFDPQQQARDLQAISSALSSATPALLAPAPATPFNRPVSGQRSHAVIPLSFAEIRGVRAVLGGTINDVVLTTLSGGLGAYLRSLGRTTAGLQLRAMVPVNVRPGSEQAALGNQVSLLIAMLPVGIEDAADRHAAVLASMNRLKEANQAGGFALLTRLSEWVPPSMQAYAGLFAPNGQQLFNLVCTNVPGPQIPLYLAGRMVEEHWPLVPVSMGLGLNVALTSYNGVLYWGLVADPSLVPDVEAVAGFISAAFDELKAAAVAAAPTAG